MVDPWTLYWQSNVADSCIPAKSRDDAEPIRVAWRDFANALPHKAVILDLATGNGVVPRTLLDTREDLKVVAVDKARIDPRHFLSDPGVLEYVEFRADIDICALPFDARRFDAVASQFGIEYAPADEAITEAVRVAKPGAHLQFIMHHADSEIVAPVKDKRREMADLLADDGVLETLAAVLDGRCDMERLEQVGRVFLDGAPRNRDIGGQIFEGVNRALGHARRGDSNTARELSETMRVRLSAEYVRLEQLEAAALDDDGFSAFSALVEAAGVTIRRAETLVAREAHPDEFLIGWIFNGRKSG